MEKFIPDIDVKFPFSIACDNEQLEENIKWFNKNEYDEQLNTFHKKVGLVFNGDASEKLAKIIYYNMSDKKV